MLSIDESGLLPVGAYTFHILSTLRTLVIEGPGEATASVELQFTPVPLPASFISFASAFMLLGGVGFACRCKVSREGPGELVAS